MTNIKTESTDEDERTREDKHRESKGYMDDSLVGRPRGRLETSKYTIGLQGKSELISSKNNAGHLPLHSAARNGNLDCVKLLLAQGVSQEEGEDALIEAGADLNIPTNDGKTCLHLVVTLWGGHERTDKKVQTTNGFEQVSSVYPEYEPLTENEKLLLYLLDKGAMCETFDARGNTPVHYTTTHRLWQLVVSRIPEEKRSNVLADLALESENIKRTVKKTIGPDGGEIYLKRYGVQMMIPAGALDEDQEIVMKLLGSSTEPAIQDGEMLASFGVQLNPCGLKFKKPVQIKLPHCAKIASTSPVEMVLYHSRDSDVTTTDMVSHDLRDTPAVVVQERDFVLYIGEFCKLVATFKNCFFGKEVRCFISSKPCSSSNQYKFRITLADDIPNEVDDLLQYLTTDGYEKITESSWTPFYVKWNSASVSIALFDNKSEKCIEEVTEDDIYRRTQNEINFLGIDTDSCTKLQVRLFHGKRKDIPCNTPGEVMREQPTSESTHVNISAHKLKEDQLFIVMKKIPHDKYNDLSVRLGYDSIDSNKIRANHPQDIGEAILEVLRGWNRRTPCNHKDELIQALKDIDLAGQIIEIFPDYVSLTGLANK